MKGLLLSLLVLVAIGGLGGCVTVRADEVPAGTYNAPEDAVFEWMHQQPSKVANTTAIRQVLQLDEYRAPVLVSFRPEGWKGETDALVLFNVERERGHWVVRNYDYNPVPSRPDEPLTFYSPGSDSVLPFSAVYGVVDDDQVTHIAITWGDGLEQVVSVVRGSYASIRSDAPDLQATQAIAFDAQGNIVAERTNQVAER